MRAKVTASAPDARCWTKRVMRTPATARLARGPTKPMDNPMKLRTGEALDRALGRVAVGVQRVPGVSMGAGWMGAPDAGSIPGGVNWVVAHPPGSASVRIPCHRRPDRRSHRSQDRPVAEVSGASDAPLAPAVVAACSPARWAASIWT